MPGRVFNKGFTALMFTQFFGAVNDNLLKGVLSFAVATGGIWADKLGPGGQSYVGLCLTVPFILLSGLAGQVADRTSKRTVSVAMKAAEIAIALVGLVAFLAGNLWLGLAVMLLLAIQSTFFGPAKYGIIPELVEDSQLSQANGTINMFTNLAVIFGTLLAGPVYSAMVPENGAAPRPWIPGVALLTVALIGYVTSLPIPKLKAVDPSVKLSFNLVDTYWVALRDMARGPLLLVATAWAGFYLVGMLAILILPDYRDLLQVTPTKASVLLGILGIAIGIGSVTAGLISGKHIEPRLVPVGAVGLAIFLGALGLTPLHYGLVASLLAGAGFFAGFYIVPLQALLQHLSPADERGRFLGTANALSFIASSVGNLIYLFARRFAGMEPNRIFLIAGGLAFLGSGILLWRLRRLLIDPSLRHPDNAV
ncbi:acyl-[acyl-carrier-protein]-phospholipid O-acyltransferase/long-chain-fatty-acid--[acyl-carrier-protein] ligase [Haloferula luteola]|uniref:Acyl-[acyl-carrier-protein]-phospholipid O-acyltransferase/long-chain-fatty-acid--[acyl-carrier-protein] ligase n=1 Tax=Haloferula luteola TaxID=595692 RepID=A0A840V5C9_9BACT|nr:MFS transporter [Haloferula luteola]MBB5353225.1 acyl-[acyl-carrier-protein]-phospholipid O-acyltransferase/long-chain-fatty-acid--[acyl-carrier-protein] ligase [Haloferula luteola]